MKTENTQVAVTPETLNVITQRVNSTNKFTKDEVERYRPQITAARKEKRERLGAMKASDVSSIVSKHMEQGFAVRDSKATSLKTGDKVVIELFRKNGAAPKPKAISEMSIEEITAALGDKAGEVLKALAMKAQAANA